MEDLGLAKTAVEEIHSNTCRTSSLVMALRSAWSPVLCS